MITKRGDGRWVATVTLDGVKTYVYGNTRKEVKSKLSQQDSMWYSKTVESFVAEWLRKMRPAWSHKTYTSYEGEVRNHIIPHIGKIPLQELTPDHIYTLLDTLQREERSTRSINYSVSVLSRALNWGVKWGEVRQNVVKQVALPRYEYRQFTPLTVPQAKQLLNAVKDHRLEMLYRLALSLGMRQGELIRLKWEDIDMETRTLRVKESKTRAGRRSLELPEPLYLALVDHRQRQAQEMAGNNQWTEHGLVFPSNVGTPLLARNIHRHFKQALRSAGLPDHVRFHDMRHSCAAFLIAQGVDIHIIKEVLGHSKISVTSDTYGHLLPGVGGAALARVAGELE